MKHSKKSIALENESMIQIQKLREIIIEIVKQRHIDPTLSIIVDNIIDKELMALFVGIEDLSKSVFLSQKELKEKIQKIIINIAASNSAVFFLIGYCHVEMCQLSLPSQKNTSTIYLVKIDPAIIRINYFDFTDKKWKFVDQHENDFKEKGINLEQIQESWITDNEDYIKAITLMCSCNCEALVNYNLIKLHLLGYHSEFKKTSSLSSNITYSSSDIPPNDFVRSHQVQSFSRQEIFLPYYLPVVQEGTLSSQQNSSSMMSTQFVPLYTFVVNPNKNNNLLKPSYKPNRSLPKPAKNHAQFILPLVEIIIAQLIKENRLLAAKIEGVLKIKVSDLITILLDRYTDALKHFGFNIYRNFYADFIRFIKQIDNIDPNFYQTFFLDSREESIANREQKLHVFINNPFVGSIVTYYLSELEKKQSSDEVIVIQKGQFDQDPIEEFEELEQPKFQQLLVKKENSSFYRQCSSFNDHQKNLEKSPDGIEANVAFGLLDPEKQKKIYLGSWF